VVTSLFPRRASTHQSRVERSDLPSHRQIVGCCSAACRDRRTGGRQQADPWACGRFCPITRPRSIHAPQTIGYALRASCPSMHAVLIDRGGRFGRPGPLLARAGAAVPDRACGRSALPHG
jgi:hypothetical protein